MAVRQEFRRTAEEMQALALARDCVMEALRETPPSARWSEVESAAWLLAARAGLENSCSSEVHVALDREIEKLLLEWAPRAGRSRAPQGAGWQDAWLRAAA